MNELNVIYHFHASQNLDGEFRPASYKMVYLFHEDGLVDSSLILETLKAFPDSNYQDKTFLNLDDLKAFSMRLGETLEASKVRLISVQDYNIGIDGAKDLKSFRDLFSKYGEAFINEAVSKKKNFFGKLFS